MSDEQPHHFYMGVSPPPPGISSRHIRVLGQFQINKKLTSKQTQQTQQQTFPSFPHKLKLFPIAKPNTTYIFVLILANDELFEFCVSCGEFGGNMKVFVEFVLRLIFVDFGLAQNPYMPTTGILHGSHLG